MYYLLGKLRKQGIKCNTPERTIFYYYGSESSIDNDSVKELCTKYGFARQSTIPGS